MAPKTKYTREELQALIAETRSELNTLLKAETVAVPPENGGQMVKADDDGGDKKAPPKEESSASESGSSDAPPAPASDAASAGGPPDASASAGAPPAAPAPDASASAGSAGGAPADLPTLVAAYSQLAPEELAMHAQALQQVMAAQPPAGAPAGGPPGAPAGAPPAAAPASPAAAPMGAPAPGPDAVAPMPGEGSKPIDPTMMMGKKESDKELLEKLTKAEGSVKTLEGNVEKLVKAMELMLTRPQRKAVTGKDLAKSAAVEEAVDVTKLNKAQLTQKLVEIAKKPELKKSERNLINSFYKGQIKVEALAPLFEKK